MVADNKNTRNEIKIITNREKILISTILASLNLFNYIDRYTLISVVESQLKCPFRLSDTDIGLLQTFFYLTYMLFSPIVGHYGDNYSRKKIIAVGVSIWVLGLFIGYSVDTPEMCSNKPFIDSNWKKLLVSRAIFGTGETFYICLSTAILHDLWQEDSDRMKWFSYFCMMIPIGSGLGYICGGKITSLTGGNWQLATVAFTPLTICALIAWLMLPDVPHRYSQLLEMQENNSYEPRRDNNNQENEEIRRILDISTETEESTHKMKLSMSSENSASTETTTVIQAETSNFDPSIKAKLRRLLKNKTYMLVVVAEIAVCWCCGAGSAFFPVMIQRAENLETVTSQEFVENLYPKLEISNETLLSTVLDEHHFIDVNSTNDQTNDSNQITTNNAQSPTNQENFRSCYEEGNKFICSQVDQNSSVMATFGAIVTAAGFIGAFLGGKLPINWKVKYGNKTADTDSSAISQFIAGLATFLTIFFVTDSPYLYWSLLFLSFTGLNFIWPVYNNIILSVVDARDKCFATAAINLISHALGDLVSPFLVGRYSEKIQIIAKDVSPELDSTLLDQNFNSKGWAFVEFNSLQQAMLLLPIVFMVASIFFFLSSRFYSYDKRKADLDSVQN